MSRKVVGRSARVGLVVFVFAAGFFVGSVSERRADAQLGEMGKQMGKDMMQKAGEGGGVLGTAVQLGNAIVDMQQNVDSLQKNINVLKKVKESLGG